MDGCGVHRGTAPDVLSGGVPVADAWGVGQDQCPQAGPGAYESCSGAQKSVQQGQGAPGGPIGGVDHGDPQHKGDEMPGDHRRCRRWYRMR